jgi:hypothetical protein
MAARSGVARSAEEFLACRQHGGFVGGMVDGPHYRGRAVFRLCKAGHGIGISDDGVGTVLGPGTCLACREREHPAAERSPECSACP